MKRFFTSLVITTCALIGYAQQAIGTLNVKPFVGATLTRLQPITDNKMKMNAGVVAGAELEYQLLEKASVSAGVQFLTQGAKKNKSFDDFGNTITKSLYTEYLSIPLTFNYYVIPNLAVKAGFEGKILTHSQFANKDITGKNTHNLTKTLNQFLVALPLGVSYEYNHFVLEARYSLPLTKISKGRYMALTSTGEFPLNGNYHTFQITLGYKFKI